MSHKPMMRPHYLAAGNTRFVIEICFRGRWLPLGDKAGIFSFATGAERDEAIKKFQLKFDEEGEG